jgi:hypothetical protein
MQPSNSNSISNLKKYCPTKNTFKWKISFCSTGKRTLNEYEYELFI